MINIRISEDALEDLNDGFWFYESQEGGLGGYFTTHLKSDIEGLKVTGGIHRQTYKDYHRLLSRVFPYAIYYTMDGDGSDRVGSNRLQARSGLDSPAFGQNISPTRRSIRPLTVRSPQPFYS